MFFANHPDYIRDVLVTQNSNFGKGRALEKAKRILGSGLLTSEGETHHRQRRLVLPAFHRQRIASYGSVMVEHATRMADDWQEGMPVDISQEMTRLTLGIVAKTLFDADVGKEADEIGEAMTVMMEMFHLLMYPFAEVLEKLPLPMVRRYKRMRLRLDSTIYKIINERRKSGVDRQDLLSMLLLAQDEEDGGKMTDAQVRDEAMTLFLAGHETTANALSWTFYLLSQNPVAEANLHAELDEVIGSRAPTTEDVAKLQYTEKVVSESIRLFPPAWGIGRRSLVDQMIGPYRVPADSIVLLSPFVTQRDPRFFSEPDRIQARTMDGGAGNRLYPSFPISRSAGGLADVLAKDSHGQKQSWFSPRCASVGACGWINQRPLNHRPCSHFDQEVEFACGLSGGNDLKDRPREPYCPAR